MSLPACHIKCTRCEFVVSTSVIWGHFAYELQDGSRLDVQRTYGWCKTCESITPIEDLSPLPSCDQKMKSTREELQRTLSSLAGRLGWKKPKITELQSELQSLERSEQNIQAYNRLVNSRTSSPRCLKCSQQDILKIEVPKTTQGEKAKIGFAHPGCGGDLTAEEIGLRLAHSFKETFIYDIEGNLLRSEPFEHNIRSVSSGRTIRLSAGLE